MGKWYLNGRYLCPLDFGGALNFTHIMHFRSVENIQTLKDDDLASRSRFSKQKDDEMSEDEKQS